MCWKDIFRTESEESKKLLDHGNDEKIKFCSRKELQIFFNIACPFVLTTLCQFSLPATSLVFCGRLGTTNLAGAALANTIINVTGTSVGWGLAFACDTLFSQTYGSENKKKVGVYFQQSLIILTLSVFVCWALHLNTYPILIAMKQNPEIAKIAAEYIIWYMPGLLGSFLYQLFNKYLQNQNIVLPVLVIGIFGNICNATFHAIFLIVLELGTNGSAGAQAISFWLMLLCSSVYICCSKVYKETWDGWTWEAFQDWATFMKLAIPGMLILFLEWFSFEVATILTGLLGDVQLSSQSIMFQFEGIIFMIPLGISTAANIRVGQCLGANNIDGAKRVCKTAYCLTILLCTLSAIIVVSVRSVVAKVFSEDPKVISYVSALIPILGIFHILDGISAISTGILRGCGRQLICSIVAFIGFYVFGIPIGIPLLFLTKLEVCGYWWGLSIGLLIEDLAFTFLILKTNWEREAQLALERAGVTSCSDSNNIENEEMNLISSKQSIKRRYLILSRSIIIISILLIFGAGVFFHFYILSPTGKCTPYDNSLINGTIPKNLYPPFCNKNFTTLD